MAFNMQHISHTSITIGCQPIYVSIDPDNGNIVLVRSTSYMHCEKWSPCHFVAKTLVLL